uniref:Uncharacterized protein n=1 Tax=Panagrellus redivivus TaxID=6233 RepID=A0A7E4VKT6_PANRE
MPIVAGRSAAFTKRRQSLAPGGHGRPTVRRNTNSNGPPSRSKHASRPVSAVVPPPSPVIPASEAARTSEEEAASTSTAATIAIPSGASAPPQRKPGDASTAPSRRSTDFSSIVLEAARRASATGPRTSGRGTSATNRLRRQSSIEEVAETESTVSVGSLLPPGAGSSDLSPRRRSRQAHRAGITRVHPSSVNTRPFLEFVNRCREVHCDAVAVSEMTIVTGQPPLLNSEFPPSSRSGINPDDYDDLDADRWSPRGSGLLSRALSPGLSRILLSPFRKTSRLFEVATGGSSDASRSVSPLANRKVSFWERVSPDQSAKRLLPRRVVDLSDHKTCALLMEKMKVASRGSPL